MFSFAWGNVSSSSHRRSNVQCSCFAVAALSQMEKYVSFAIHVRSFQGTQTVYFRLRNVGDGRASLGDTDKKPKKYIKLIGTANTRNGIKNGHAISRYYEAPRPPAVSNFKIHLHLHQRPNNRIRLHIRKLKYTTRQTRAPRHRVVTSLLSNFIRAREPRRYISIPSVAVRSFVFRTRIPTAEW